MVCRLSHHSRATLADIQVINYKYTDRYFEDEEKEEEEEKYK